MGTVLYKLPKNVLCYIDAESLITEIPDDDDDDYYEDDEENASGISIKF